MKTIKILEQVGPGSWHAWQSCSASNGSWDEDTWDKKCQEVENEVKDVTRVERGEGILDVKIGGRFAPVCQEPTWNEHEEKMIGLVFKLEGKLRCALTSKLTSDDLPEYGERSGPRELHGDGRLDVRRFDHFFQTRHD